MRQLVNRQESYQGIALENSAPEVIPLSAAGELQIEMSHKTLCRLLKSHQITLSEIRCLNGETKCEIHRCLLHTLR